MNHCPITYDVISDNQHYSNKGLHQLSAQLTQLAPLTLSAAELRAEAMRRAGKMSIQGVQPKLSAQLKIKSGCFELVDQDGHYILKPPSDFYPQLPENEGITMSMACRIGIEVPVHGLLYDNDNTMTYFIKRFDRVGHKDKLAVEDFAQLSQSSRDTKYNSSMEKVAEIAMNPAFCTFPRIEALKLFKLTLFNFLVGNEDMHLKNFSLLTKNNITGLSPAYDLLNTTIALRNAKEELALPLNGRKNNLRQRDFIDYFAQTRLQLNAKTIASVLNTIQKAIPAWRALIQASFLSKEMKKNYLTLLRERCVRLKLSQPRNS